MAQQQSNDFTRSSAQVLQDNIASIIEIFNLQVSLFQLLSEDITDLCPQEMLQVTHGYKIFCAALQNSYQHTHDIAQLNYKYFSDLMRKGYVAEQDFAQNTSLDRLSKNARIFSGEIWDHNPFYSQLKLLYLMTEQYCLDWLELFEDKPQIKEQLKFYIEIFLSTIAPTNFVLTNPNIIDKINTTGGSSLLEGYRNFLKDLVDKKGQLSITLTDQSAFKPGENIACTPGNIVYKNDFIELIKYTPTTDQVYAKPMLIVPPFINKYYILDLSEKNSLVKWMVDKGYTVYMISWVNPDSSYRDKSFSDYMLQGPLAALDFLTKEAGHSDINATGYCIGGTLLACTLAYLAEKQDRRIASATFFMSLVDFFDVGELGVFIDEDQINSVNQLMDKNGFLDGRLLNLTFNLIRPYDLVWPHFINNYLLGDKTRPFDILYWNSDPTNLPQTMYHFYLQEIVLKNKLKTPGAITLNGVPIDIGKIDIPCFFLSSDADHITPWISIYEGVKLFKGPVEFILSKSGHVRAVVNPPPDNKYGYFKMADIKNAHDLPYDPKQWLQNAAHCMDSWWNHWHDWLQPHVGKKLNTAQLTKLKSLYTAPGKYVQRRL